MDGDHIPEVDHSTHASTHENSFSTAIDLGGEFVVSRASSVVVLDAGATANLVRRA